jgi:hypothetical protein
MDLRVLVRAEEVLPMTLRSVLAGVVLIGGIGLQEVPAQEVHFKTLEMKTFAGPGEPVFVDVATQRRSVSRRYRSRRRPRYVVRRRSRKKSAAIVGGSAATGAAIGALAGGGKGAGIGAIAGGGAGLIYDRKTHKKVVRER